MPEPVTPAVVPEPDKSAVEMVRDAMAAAEPEAVAETIVPAPPLAFDPKTIVIPKDAALPKHFEKYAGKTLDDVIALDLETQRYAGQQSGEVARLKRENDELRARQAARSEVAELLKPPAAPVDDWARVGITAETPVWDQPHTALEATRTLAKEDAEALVAKTRKEIREEIDAERNEERRNTALIGTFETAKAEIRKAGHAITDEEWSRDILPYIAPRLAQEETVTPGVLFDPAQYVERFHRLRGAPPAPARPTIPSEAAPPVSARSANITPQISVPTAKGEAYDMKKKVASALVGAGKWSKQEADDYLGGA